MLLVDLASLNIRFYSLVTGQRPDVDHNTLFSYKTLPTVQFLGRCKDGTKMDCLKKTN